jgi:hypothetical protein
MIITTARLRIIIRRIEFYLSSDDNNGSSEWADIADDSLVVVGGSSNLIADDPFTVFWLLMKKFMTITKTKTYSWGLVSWDTLWLKFKKKDKKNIKNTC